MANNTFQIKRTSTSGRTPNTSSSSNTQYINAGELALNMADGILYTSNGSALITVGANLVNQSITGTLTVNAISANGSLGTNGQVLTSNGSVSYWSTVSSGSGGGNLPVLQSYTADGLTNTFTVTGGYVSNNLSVYVNGIKLRNGTEANVISGTTFTILTGNPPNTALIDVVGSSSLFANGISSTVSQTITANGTANSFAITNGYIPNNIMVWLNGVKQINGTDVIVTSGANVGFVVTPPNNYIIDVFGYQGAVGFSNTFVVGNSYITNTSIYVGNSTVNSVITSTSITSINATHTGTTTLAAVSANGGVGTSGQVLSSNGSSTYWANTGASIGDAIVMALIFGG